MSDSTPQPDPKKRVAVAVLAAGLGTRMNSDTPKHLHHVGGVPIVKRIIEAGRAIDPDRLIVVVSPFTADMDERLGMVGEFEPLVQEVATGTAAAVQHALNQAPEVDMIVSLLGDNPLLTGEMIRDLLEGAINHDVPVTVMTCKMPSAESYGRIDRDDQGRVLGIVEKKNDDDSKRQGETEINSGIMVLKADWARDALARLPLDPRTGEYLLTDIVSMAVAEFEGGKWPVETVEAPQEVSVGINTRVNQAEADGMVRNKVRESLMISGVTMIGADTIFIDEQVTIGKDTTLLPGTIIRGNTSIGQGCTIGPYAVISDATIGDRVTIGQATIESSTLESDTSVGPYSRIRGGSVVKSGGVVGNFGELKNTTIGHGSKSMHFGYLGDTTIGDHTNIGAGTVTANYDGTSKNPTTIGDNVFIGSDSVLIAPVKVGDGAKSGAGSVINRDVDPNTTVVGVPAKPLVKRQ